MPPCAIEQGRWHLSAGSPLPESITLLLWMAALRRRLRPCECCRRVGTVRCTSALRTPPAFTEGQAGRSTTPEPEPTFCGSGVARICVDGPLAGQPATRAPPRAVGGIRGADVGRALWPQPALQRIPLVRLADHGYFLVAARHTMIVRTAREVRGNLRT